MADGTGPGSEPVFSGVDFSGGIWDAHPYGVAGGPVSGSQQLLEARVVFDNAQDAVAAGGRIVQLLVDTTGIDQGQFPLRLISTEIADDTAFVFAGDVALAANVANGTITIDAIAPVIRSARWFSASVGAPKLVPRRMAC